MSDSAKLTWRQTVFQLCIAVISLYVAIRIVPSVTISAPLTAAVAVGFIRLFQLLFKPFFGFITKVLGIIGILFISLFGNAFIVWLVFVLLPGITVASFWGGFFASWLYAIIITFFNWVFVSQSDDVFLASIMRGQGKPVSPEKQGYLFIQLDGVSAPVLDWQLKAGNLTNIAKLLREEDYVFRTWHTQVPSTTPASQAGILFGNNADIPAFRWYEKKTKSMVVANQSKGAQLIEQRLSNGSGLLVDGGVSIGNLFSGDAKKNIMVMSRVDGDRESIKSMQEYSAYFYTPLNFMRSFIMSIGEMAKEVYQARRQATRDMQPRIKRHGSYVLLRAITNVLMRDLQTTIVIQNMMKGVNSIYVDYLDYDEVAHHAGIARAESLASLTGLDRVLGIIRRANSMLPKPYEIIIVSDHGQSQGPTFKQLHNGKTLEEFVAEYTGNNTSVSTSLKPVEEQSVTRALLSQQSSRKKGKRSLLSSIQKKFEHKHGPENETLTDIVVTGSGNLGNIWLTMYSERATLEQLESDHPQLIDKLLKTKGIGLVLVMSHDGPLCFGPRGTLNLKTGMITSDNPLKYFPSHVQSSLLKVSTMKNAPDVVVISEYNQETGEVYAFEELVGNHGGIGGWQTEAILLHPGHLKIPHSYESDGILHDATTIHKILKNWLTLAGHKKQ